jgi:2,3-bisphosphoglycerate-dependent phosphoglycerate mutase
MELILVRHGFSEGNEDMKNHHLTADHAIPLTPKGVLEARKSADKIQGYLRTKYQIKPDLNKIRMWVSPYLRTRQTADEIEKISWWDNSPIISSRREDITLCEQQFGLFDGLSDEELEIKYPNEYAHYEKCEKFEGRFWARMPLGESRFDVSLRVHQIFGTWQRDFERHGTDTVIVVSHGVTIRAIIMRWLHLPFEWFEKEKNPANCSVRIIEGGKDLGYL